jgi:uncharacterized membrane protein YedE/YeeE
MFITWYVVGIFVAVTVVGHLGYHLPFVLPSFGEGPRTSSRKSFLLLLLLVQRTWWKALSAD